LGSQKLNGPPLAAGLMIKFLCFDQAQRLLAGLNTLHNNRPA
jgi:hypothetical protein